MRQEIEIEFKNLLTKNEFEILLDTYHLTKNDFICQENHYFDTPDFRLKHKRAALRIRKKEKSYVLTLKQPHHQGLLETHHDLTEREALLLLNGGSFQQVGGELNKIIKKMGIEPKDIQYLGALKTERAEIKDGENLIVLDHSYYLGYEDYELEYEVKEMEQGKQNFLALLLKHKIPQRPARNKIQRFFQIKAEKED